MSEIDLKPYKIEYGYMDEDGVSHMTDTEAETMIHAADILYRLNPQLWSVITHDINGKKKDVTGHVHHAIVRYIAPCNRDGREISSETFRETAAIKRFLEERRTNVST